MKSVWEHPLFGPRLTSTGIVVWALFSTLLFRLWYLQGVQGGYYRDLSENNRIRTVRTAAPRGNVYDREGRVIVRNRPAFDIALMLEDVSDVHKALQLLAEITSHSVDELEAQLHSQKSRHPFEPKVVMADVSLEDLARVKVNSYRLPGVIVNVKPRRAYPYEALAAQLIGYAREISEVQLKKRTDAGYAMGDMVGQAGLESGYENELRGRAGYIQVEVDARGNRKQELGIVDNSSGDDITLTIDLDLQRAAEEALAGERGAVVAIDPRNGEVLTLASAPAYDANVFSGEVSNEAWAAVNDNPWLPLNNRAIAARYAPGSTFKLVMTIAGLAEKKVSPDHEFFCPGYYKFKDRRYRCHKKTGHGSVDLKTAVTVSCDSYFYQLGQLLGVELIHKYATLMGLGAPVEIDLPNENAGLVPSEEWKLRTQGERWYPGETLSVSIGQGALVVTPLQMAVMVAAVANGGTVFRPIVVKKIVHAATGQVEEQKTTSRQVPVDKSIFDKVRSYAVSAVEDPRGTGKRAQISGIIVGGKTGTSQVISLDKTNKSKEYQDHAWFISFAPAENPTIAIAVVVEHGGHGGTAAAPISKKIMEVYFRKLGMLATAEDGAKPDGKKVSAEEETPVEEEREGFFTDNE